MDAHKIVEFKRKFSALLKEYNVMIGFSVGESSDTYGLHGERIVVSTRTDRVNKTAATEIMSVEGWWMDHTDIK